MKIYNKKYFLILLFSLIVSHVILAGDISTFVNLGFSPDGKFYMFGEHGYKIDEGKTYANINIVDVQTNSFVPSGSFSGTYTANVEPSQSSDGAFLRLYEQTITRKNQYKISTLNKGYPLYIFLGEPTEKDENYDPNTLNFFDPQGNQYTIVLNVEHRKNPNQSSSSIQLTRKTPAARTTNYTIGHPDFWRDGVALYRIQRVLSFNGNALAFIISKEYTNLDVRYMVETLYF